MIFSLSARFLFTSLGIILLGCCLTCCSKKISEEEATKIVFNIPEGFELEELYSPSLQGQGSWVSIAEGPNGFFASDQYGAIYTFKAPAVGSVIKKEDVDSLALNIGFAQGLLWAFNSLYVSVAEGTEFDNPEKPSSGVYRLQDLDGDGTLEDRQKILTLDGTGEHGPHTMRIGPDGQSIYFIAGNFNKIPNHFSSRLPKHWDEDNVFPKYLDAMGHATELKAPGGWIAKTDPEGKSWEIVGAGMRNPFSFGFNAAGDLFAYDADMEWDFGMPWYRPTRIVHVTSGAEFGWRTGSGKWPAYLPDNLPAVVNMDQGSPTAVIMGKDLSFPERYKNGLFACDWSFGTMYFVDLIPNGSSYVGKKEEFLSGVPLPITNATAGKDGKLYFLTGGRRISSSLYRLRATNEAISNNPVIELTEETKLRRNLERYHNVIDKKAVDASWPYLDHQDRQVRYAARIAIEHQPLNDWRSRLMQELSPLKLIYGVIAYARKGGEPNDQVFNNLARIEWEKLSVDQQIDLVRAYQLLFIRHQEKGIKHQLTAVANRLDSFFPSGDARLNRELSQLLVYANHPDAVAKCMTLIRSEAERATSSHPDIISEELIKRSEQYGPQIADMLANMPPTEAIHYAMVLSNAQTGWSQDLRKEYFQWFYAALSKKGGMSYKGFLDNMRARALKHVPDDQRGEMAAIAGFYSPIQEMADLPQPVGPGREYTLMDLGPIVLWNDDRIKNYTGSLADGERAFKAALCYSCHRMNGEGAASGPDLSNLYSRFSLRDMTGAVIMPNEEISEQFAFTVFSLNNGETLSGRIVEDKETSYKIYQSPYAMNATTEILKADVKKAELSPISPMPAKLLDRLNEQEIVDLFVYLLAGGKPNDQYYKKGI